MSLEAYLVSVLLIFIANVHARIDWRLHGNRANRYQFQPFNAWQAIQNQLQYYNDLTYSNNYDDDNADDAYYADANIYDLFNDELNSIMQKEDESDPNEILRIKNGILGAPLKKENGDLVDGEKTKFSDFWVKFDPKMNNKQYLKTLTKDHGILIYGTVNNDNHPYGIIKWAPKGKDTHSKINWKTLETEFNAGRMGEAFGRAVGHLRVQTMWFLLHKVANGEGGIERFKDSKVCWAEFGSKTVTSDLDWSFANWKNPQNVVNIAVKWYQAFHSIYGGYPGEVFDMNMYIEPHMVKTKQCYDHIGNVADNAGAKRMKTLFTEHEHKVKFDLESIQSQYKMVEVKVPEKDVIWKEASGDFVLTRWWDPSYNVIWTFGRYADPKYRRYDQYISFLMNEKKMEQQSQHHQGGFADQLENFGQAKWFYEILDRIKKGDISEAMATDRQGYIINDETMLYMVCICRWTMFNANEATTTLQALAQQGTGSPPRIAEFDDYDFYLSYMDWFHFIDELFQEHKAKNRESTIADFVYFWDRISKYVWRTWEAVSETALRNHPYWIPISQWNRRDLDKSIGYSGLYDFAELWKKLIRGKKEYTLADNFIKPLEKFKWSTNPYAREYDPETDKGIMPKTIKKKKRLTIVAVYAGLQNLHDKALKFDRRVNGNGAGGDAVVALFELLSMHKEEIQRIFLLQNDIAKAHAEPEKWIKAIDDVKTYIDEKVVTNQGPPLQVTVKPDVEVPYKNPFVEVPMIKFLMDPFVQIAGRDDPFVRIARRHED